MVAYIAFADRVSAWFGKSFGWLILLMTLCTAYEVVARYVFNAPTPWAFDVSYICYGALFMMGGAWALSQNGHVRGDFAYRSWPPRRQAAVDLVLYLTFFFPGVLALVFVGWKYAARSWGYGEVSVNSPAGVPIYQLKMVMVAAGTLLAIQGLAQIFRCILCLRTGRWMTAEAEVKETEDLLIEAARKTAGDAK
ncbi:MAG: TRAP transporter small permease subunit [Rhodobacterales bacterium]|nr:TRAP transporter small permease subunit [Rhodobacterales bacterium]